MRAPWQQGARPPGPAIIYIVQKKGRGEHKKQQCSKPCLPVKGRAGETKKRGKETDL